MRMPNTKCTICGKPLYRRPFEFVVGREFCCRGCRSELYKRRIPSPNLELGREKGTNHLNGIPKSDEMKRKVSKKNKLFWKNNPDKLIERGLKTRGDKHYNWKGGISSLQIATRTSAHNINWIKRVLERDNYECQLCKSVKKLEVHHKVGLAKIVKDNMIKTLDDARDCKELWNIDNGIVLCKKCHYKIHNRKYYED